MLLLKDRLTVCREVGYPQVIGGPMTQLGRYSDWAADGLLDVDIAARPPTTGPLRREHLHGGRGDVLATLEHVALGYMPLTIRGGSGRSTICTPAVGRGRKWTAS